MQELRADLQEAISAVQNTDHAVSASIASGCELLLRFITLTVLDFKVCAAFFITSMSKNFFYCYFWFRTSTCVARRWSSEESCFCRKLPTHARRSQSCSNRTSATELWANLSAFSTFQNANKITVPVTFQTILTHSRSRVVLQVLKAAVQSKHRFTVYVTGSQPDKAGLVALCFKVD